MGFEKGICMFEVKVPDLGKGLLPVVLEVPGVDIEVVLVDGERLRALGDARYKLLHLQEGAVCLAALKVPHRDVGGGDAVWEEEKQGEVRRADKCASDSVLGGFREVYWLRPGPRCQWSRPGCPGVPGVWPSSPAWWKNTCMNEGAGVKIL